MIKAARLCNLFVLLIVVGIFIAGIPSTMRQGQIFLVGSAIFVALVGLPIVPALMVLGNKEGKSKTESFAMYVNKSYLFLLAAGAVGFAFRYAIGLQPAFISYLPGGAMISLVFLLNILALDKQKQLRASSSTKVVLYAGFWNRLFAFILDFFIVSLVTIIMYTGVNWLASSAGVGNGKPILVNSYPIGFLLTSWLYFAIMENSPKQATFGKIALGIKVVDHHGRPISFGRASVRFFGKVLSVFTFYIGFLMAAFTKRKQAIHDMLANCLIVNKEITPSDIEQSGPVTGISTTKGVVIVIAATFVFATVFGTAAALFIPVYADYTRRAR